MRLGLPSSLVLSFLLGACGASGLGGGLARPSRTPPPSATADISGTPTAYPTTVVPILWQELGLSGRLVYIEGAQRVDELDLSTGVLRVLFEAPFGGWVTAAAVSPDGASIAMAYAAPPDPGTVASYTGIYLLPREGSAEPIPLVLPPAPESAYFNPAYAPDGSSMYLVLLERTPQDPNQAFSQTIGRYWIAEDQFEPLAEGAFYPRPSPDGTELAYVLTNPVDYSNELVLTTPDASNPRSAVDPGLLPYIDSPVFSTDSTWLYFSAVGTGLSRSPSWLDRALGVIPAEAHSLPSDWWRVSVEGGPPERLTELGLSGLFGAPSPDGRFFAFLSSNGLYAMNLDGTGMAALLETWGSGSLDWTP
jgi:Tol biopolymer transport system component